MEIKSRVSRGTILDSKNVAKELSSETLKSIGALVVEESADLGRSAVTGY